MDSGNGTLSIDLSAGERLKVVSNGTGYSFVSTTQTFTDNGVDDPDDFTGFDTDTLGLIGLAQYTSVSITDSGAGASVQLLDSGVNAYVHDFEITLDDGAFGQSIVFDGGAHFGNHSLTANSDRSIQLFTGTNLTTVDGDIILKGVNTGDATGALRGVALVAASITTSGTGDILFNGIATGAGPASDRRIGISLQGASIISSTGTATSAGRISLNGVGGACIDFNFGVVLGDATAVSSVMGDILITGRGGDGTGIQNYGVRLANGVTI